MFDPGNEQAWSQFRGEMIAATRANMNFPLVSSWRSAAEAMRWLRLNLPYRFVPTTPVASLQLALQRRYGACAEAASVLAAWARLAHRTVFWCLERRPDRDPHYAHVVAHVDGVPYDVYAEAARVSRGCSFTWSV